MTPQKKYNNPKVKIVEIKTSSILATSGSVQSPTTTPRQQVEPEVKPSMPSKITYDVVEENIFITIPSATGLRKIQEKAVVVPDGSKCILYNCYIYTMKQFVQNATDIPYYIEKMQQALDFKNQNISTRDIILKVAMRHISNHGRIIDGDLSMIISAVSKVTEQNLDTDLEWSGLDIVLDNNRDKVFFTRYETGSEPILIPASEYLRIS
ncbi:MAG: hypothetical protein J6W52_05110 [Bacteroidaceae bacterium]|nr:hypothetical protein [Bacteroidaceae bacterium]